MGLLTPNILNILPSSEKVYPLSSAVAIDFSAFEIASKIDPPCCVKN
jgi:hypothetical protein